MLADQHSEAFVKNFTGQWLQARDVENVPIESRAILAREETLRRRTDPHMRKRFSRVERPSAIPVCPIRKRKSLLPSAKRLFSRFRSQPRADLNSELRRAMRQETETVFTYVLKENRSVLELLDSDYTFLETSAWQNIMGSRM